MFLFSPFELIAVLFALVFAYPWALILLPHERRSWLALGLTTLGLSLGALTLWMLALVLIGALERAGVVMGIVVLAGAGLMILLRTQTPASGTYPRQIARQMAESARGDPLVAGLVAVVLGMAGLILFNALYWPFGDHDAISIYATQSLRIYQTRDLPTGEGLYEAYPMMLQLAYNYTYFVAGGINEYLARILPVALDIGTLGAAALLGGALYGRRAGLIAAGLLALTPSYARWASTGYVDIPAGFFFTLAGVFAWWLFEHDDPRDALLMGIMAGLAAWTKNSALTLAVSMIVWLAYGRWRGAIRLSNGALALAGLALTAGPWYLRNLILWGRVVPKTVWTDQAQHTVANLFPFVIHPGDFWVPGIIVTLGIGLIVWDVLRGDSASRDRAALLLIMALPFGAAWWWMASYEPRFLLTALPLGVVMGAQALIAGLGRVKWAGLQTRPYHLLALLLIVALALPSARKAIVFKGELARDPFMDTTKRHQVRLGPVYDVAQQLNTLPAEGTILSDNHYLPFYARTAQAVVGGMPSRDRLARYDYLLYSPGSTPPDFVQPGDIELLFEIDGFRVYRVRHP